MMTQLQRHIKTICCWRVNDDVLGMKRRYGGAQFAKVDESPLSQALGCTLIQLGLSVYIKTWIKHSSTRR